jgi:hypothetical protein
MDVRPRSRSQEHLRSVSEPRMRDMFALVDGVLGTHPEVGEYNQKI